MLVLDGSSSGAPVGPGRLRCGVRCWRDHRLLAGGDGGDDLGVVDALEIDGGDPEVGTPQLALADVERDALVREFDGVGVAQLVRCEPPPHAGLGGDASELGPG